MSSSASLSALATKAPAVSRQLQVHFVPRWLTNPYHALLTRHLAAQDVVVHEDSRLKQIWIAAKRRGRKPDVLHIHVAPRFSLAPASCLRFALFWRRLFQLQRLGVRLVWTVHNIGHHEAYFPKVDRYFSQLLFRKADAVILHSDGAREMVEKQWQVKRSQRLYVIPHGHFIEAYAHGISQTEARAKLNLPQQALVVLFLGNIRPYKGVVPLVKTFREIDRPDVHLLIAGETLGDELSREIVQAAGDDRRIDFRPHFVPDDQVQAHMSAADVVIFPYTQVLTSGALVLAMGFGKACIAPRMGALGDTLDSDGGFLYEPGDSAALKKALLRAVEMRSQLAAMGRHNRERAAQWGWDGVATQTKDAYLAALAFRRDDQL